METKKRKCDGEDCEVELPVRKFKKLIKNGKKKYFCKDCYKKVKNHHREETLKESGIVEVKVIKEIKSDWKEVKEAKPAIKSIKLKDKKQKSFSTISQLEKQLIFKSCINKGMSYQEADARTKDLVEFLKERKVEIRNKHKTNEAAEINWLEELNKAVDCLE
jgi:hypothetical protein